MRQKLYEFGDHRDNAGGAAGKSQFLLLLLTLELVTASSIQ